MTIGKQAVLSHIDIDLLEVDATAGATIRSLQDMFSVENRFIDKKDVAACGCQFDDLPGVSIFTVPATVPSLFQRLYR